MNILIINSQSSRKDNATGITLRGILSGINPQNLLELYRFESTNNISSSVPFRQIQIPPTNVPFNYIFRKILGYDNFFEKESAFRSNCDKKNKLHFKNILKEYIRFFLESSIIIPSSSFIKIIDEFHPDIIYTLGSEFFTHHWVLFLSRRYSIPVVMHYMDNWRETAYMKDKRLLVLHYLLDWQVKSIERRMKIGLTISKYMANDYQKKYKKMYIPLMNCVEPFETKNEMHRDLHLVYAGGLHLKRYISLLRISECIESIPEVKLIIYTSKANRLNYSHFFSGSNTVFTDEIDHSKISDIYNNADILIHIESFDEDLFDFIKYSISTKIPEYMISGKPILCFAPRETASYKCINESRCGVVVSSSQEIRDAISFLQKEENRSIMKKNGIEYARINFSNTARDFALNKVFNLK